MSCSPRTRPPVVQPPQACLLCGERYVPSRPATRYCSNRCKKRAKDRRREAARRIGPPRPKRDVAVRLWERVEPAGADECWPWTGLLSEAGYGILSVEGKNTGAHRVAYELGVGPIPPGLHIDHKCHTRDLSCPGGHACLHRRCCNPVHLEPVTPLENVRRGSVRRGERWRGARRLRGACAKLGPDIYLERLAVAVPSAAAVPMRLEELA